jgi:hypothetical protein
MMREASKAVEDQRELNVDHERKLSVRQVTGPAGTSDPEPFICAAFPNIDRAYFWTTMKRLVIIWMPQPKIPAKLRKRLENKKSEIENCETHAMSLETLGRRSETRE